VTVMLNTTGATVFMVAGTCYHAGEIGEEQVSSRTRKMVYVRLWGIGSLAGTIVRVMQSSIKVIAGSEQSTFVSGDASHVRHARRSIATPHIGIAVMFSRHFICRNPALSGSDFNYLQSVCNNNARDFCQICLVGKLILRSQLIMVGFLHGLCQN